MNSDRIPSSPRQSTHETSSGDERAERRKHSSNVRQELDDLRGQVEHSSTNSRAPSNERTERGVLLVKGTPRQVVTRKNTQGTTTNGQPISFSAGESWFLLEQKETEVLVSRDPDRDLPVGWLPVGAVSNWDTRQVILDSEGRISGYVQTMDTVTIVYWSVDTGEQKRIPQAEMERAPVSVFHETEVNDALVGLMRLAGLIDSQKVQPQRMLQVLTQYVQEPHTNLIDKSAIRETVTRFANQELDFLQSQELSEALKSVRKTISSQIEQLVKLGSGPRTGRDDAFVIGLQP